MHSVWRVLTAVFVGAAVSYGDIARSAVTNAPPKASYADVEGLTVALRTAASQLQSGDMKDERTILNAIVASPAFDRLGADLQHAAWFLLAAADADNNDDAKALDDARKATTFKGATALDWHMRFTVALAVGDTSDCITSLQTIARTWPNTLGQISDEDITGVIERSKTLTAPSTGEYDLLSALFDANWSPASLYVRPDNYWARLTLLEIDRGNLDRAFKVAETIEQHGVLIGFRVDRRFDALVARDPSHFDPARGAKVALATARKAVADNPGSLAAINSLADLLLQLGHDQEALDLLDAALAKALPADGSRSQFGDASEVIWTLDHRESALNQLGRFDEAVEQLKNASRRPEHGQINVSQAINLGDLLNSLGRPSEAKAAVADITRRDVSNYGALAADHVRVCAAVQLGDIDTARQLAARMSEHDEDGYGPYAAALYCLGDLDKLAALYIKRLKGPDTRFVALVKLQDYDNGEAITPFDKVMEARSKALMKRPDVQAEINKVGRVQSWPFASSGVW